MYEEKYTCSAEVKEKQHRLCSIPLVVVTMKRHGLTKGYGSLN